MPRRIALLCACLSFTCLRPATALADDVIVLAAQDTTLYANGDGLSNGAGDQLFAGSNSTGLEKRALVRFDVLQALPVGARIVDVSLSLELTRTQSATTTIAMHRMSAQWTEGTSNAPGEEGSGAPASDSDATWTHRSWPNVLWSQPGGDFDPEPHAATDVGDLGTYTWHADALAADVQEFLDNPASNLGWMLLANDGGTAKRFASHENPAGNGPRLTIRFDPPAATTGACCLTNGTCGVVLAPGAACEGMYVGDGTACGSGVCAEVTGACCRPIAECAVEARSACDGAWMGAGSACEEITCPVVLEPFVDPLPRPVVATPMADAEHVYRLRVFETTQKLHRDLPATRVWGYHDGTRGGFPGPTIEARSGRPISVIWSNDLRDDDGRPLRRHRLPVDTCIHGASDDTPRIVTHLHGGLVPSAYDGQPDLTLLPGEETRYEYPNAQRAATLWYHDHAVGITRLNVYMGLAGFYLVRDDHEDALDLPAGEHEIALALQDRTIDADGTLRYPQTWQETFFGEHPVLNGKISPYLEVDRGKYRFRVLNGSTSRTYTLSLSDGRAFLQIGTDGGLLPQSISMREITIGPGERVDLVFDFEWGADTVYLRNSAATPFPGGGAGPALTDLMKFVVHDEPGHQQPIPVVLSTIPDVDASHAVMERDLVIQKSRHEHCGGDMWLINGLEWDDITERPHLGTSEIWRFINRSGVMHPMHLHSLFFRVLDRQPFVVEDDQVVLVGEPSKPLRREMGYQDTVQVGPFEVVRVLAPFEDYEGVFPYHCHLLEHEDHGMMRQLEAMAVCGDGAVARGFETCDDGNSEPGDGCDEACQREPIVPHSDSPRTTSAAPACAVAAAAPRGSWMLWALAVMWRGSRRRSARPIGLRP